MSRCFPYPPPGYTLRGDRKEALIESIKLQKDKLKSEEQRRKERKREKKEKKEKKKEKKNKTTHQNHEKEKSLENSKVVPTEEKSRAALDVKGLSLLHKVSKSEADQLERSSLTEERGKPVVLPSTSSDSTENSNKRKRQSEPSDCPPAHGKIIRIKLSSKKQNQSNDVSVNEQQACSTSGRTDFPSFSKENVVFRQRTQDLSSCTLLDQKVELIPAQKVSVPAVTTLPMERSSLMAKSNTDQQQVIVPAAAARDQICSNFQQIEPVKKLSRVERNALKYKNLTEMWVPPQLDFALANDTDDDDWLFGGKKDVGVSSEKRCVPANDVMPTSCSSSSSLWPRAQYLPEVDLYALPYTIPY